MPIDREKVLQAAQRYVERKKYDRAIAEYQRIIEEDPNDARTLLKIGDLQVRLQAYPEAIATYDRVGLYYASQGFALKAIAVFKQIRELIGKHAPALNERYAHIVPKLAEIYTQLGLTSDALATWDEVATRLQKAGRDREAIRIFGKMVELDESNPLPHLRLAEACCRVQALDDAINSFWSAAQLLLDLKRREDALKVLERILHFRPDPSFARVAAELYLQNKDKDSGGKALAKLQICFQADPKNLDTLGLLARAFVAIGQEYKALEVYKEMARLARDTNQLDLYNQLLGRMRETAPNDEHVRGLETMMPPAPKSASAPGSMLSINDAELVESMPPESVSASDVEFLDELIEPIASRRPAGQSAPDIAVDDETTQHAQASVEVQEITRKALADAESFRRLRLYSKSAEALNIALEIDPGALDVRQRLCEILMESGDQDGAVTESVRLATMYLDLSQSDQAESLLYKALEVRPNDQRVLALLRRFEPESGYTRPAQDSLPSYDMEEISAADALPSEAPAKRRVGIDTVDAPFGGDDPFAAAPLPSFPLRPEADDLMAGLDLGSETQGLEQVDDISEFAEEQPSVAVEEALEESEFFAKRGLHDDARAVVVDQLARTPNHPLLLERLRELEQAAAATGASQTIDRSALGRGDGASSDDGLDELEPQEVGAVEKFRAGVRAQVAENDSSTHYDLGVAYKEMGLLQMAVDAFGIAARDPRNECMCHAMIGMIHLERDELDQAIEAYMNALNAAQRTVDQEMSVYWDLGVVYEMKRQNRDALYYFKKIARRDPSYRGVKERIEALEPSRGAPPIASRAVNDEEDFDAAFDDLFHDEPVG
ncbi:MAG TPA: tetratricopeptide repeat protein, partial [Polyangiaceae bacterium]